MLACAPRVASAQPADQFFKGKVINLYIGFAAGGSYDYYARLVARFIGKNIPTARQEHVEVRLSENGSGKSTTSVPW